MTHPKESCNGGDGFLSLLLSKVYPPTFLVDLWCVWCECPRYLVGALMYLRRLT
uniref:Uncharacterized protein n=1 Tax=Lepeophtheirus salmonis TaxID=72036 RepID=A0A0K2U4V6_LEPSM